MQTENPILADLAKLVNSAAGTMAGMGREAREEFDAVKDMAAKAREENEKLAERVKALETALKAKAKK